MQAEDLREPPLLFRYERAILMMLGFIFWMYVARRIFAKAFRHSELRWVRKLRYPPAYLLQAFALFVGAGVITMVYGGAHYLWMRTPLAHGSFVVSDYLFMLMTLGAGVLLLQLVFALCPRKAMVVGTELWIKSLGYKSWVFDLREVESVESVRAVGVLLSPRRMAKVKWRWFCCDLRIWKKGVLVGLRDGRAVFLGVTAGEAASGELRALVRECERSSRRVAPAA